VLTFFVFGALIVATGFDHSIPPLVLFALFVVKSDVGEANLIFDVAAIAIIASILVHGLTDTLGAQWLARRVGLSEQR
jgi:hypothetical protein